MTDYDIFIKELIDETTKPNGELHALARKCYGIGYEHGKQAFDVTEKIHDAYARGVRVGAERTEPSKGLPGVTEQQLLTFWNHLVSDVKSDEPALVSALVDWFNDPNRDAPQQPAMHPDVAYSARRMQQLEDECREAKAERRSIKEERLRQLEAERDAHLLEDLDLNKLPDYETWFDIHGSERTVKYETSGEQEASIHGIYNNFRARLLDELQQAGVLGVRSES